MGDDAVSRLAASITQLTLCQVSTDEIDAAIKLLDKACQKLRGILDVPPQRITDLEAAIRDLPTSDDDWKRTTERTLRVP
jgi:Fe-S-cluster formation regulator IscX/YfhJ